LLAVQRPLCVSCGRKSHVSAWSASLPIAAVYRRRGRFRDVPPADVGSLIGAGEEQTSGRDRESCGVALSAASVDSIEQAAILGLVCDRMAVSAKIAGGNSR